MERIGDDLDEGTVLFGVELHMETHESGDENETYEETIVNGEETNSSRILRKAILHEVDHPRGQFDRFIKLSLVRLCGVVSDGGDDFKLCWYAACNCYCVHGRAP